MQQFLAMGISARGGIACNEMYINHYTGVYLGRGLTDAYELEKKQDWIGVAIDSSIELNHPILFRQPFSNITDVMFPKFSVPMKGAEALSMRVVNWRFNLIAERGTRSLFIIDKEGEDAGKIENTLGFASWVVNGGRIYSYGEADPAELRAFYVGRREPPFPHGDDL